MMTAGYWIEWVIDFDLICKKRKEPSFCERRTGINVEPKFQRDIIWLIWDSLLIYMERKNNPLGRKIMNALLNIFCIKYSTGSCKKRRYLLYFAVALLTEHVPSHIEIISNKDMIQNVVEKIHEVYKQIKKNEEGPGTDYLFSNLDRNNNFENSIKRMELLQSVDITPK